MADNDRRLPPAKNGSLREVLTGCVTSKPTTTNGYPIGVFDRWCRLRDAVRRRCECNRPEPAKAREWVLSEHLRPATFGEAWSAGLLDHQLAFAVEAWELEVVL